METYEFYKENQEDTIWEVERYEDGSLIIGELLVSFDKKKIYNLWTDYPMKFSEEELAVFTKEKPYWRNFFRERFTS